MERRAGKRSGAVFLLQNRTVDGGKVDAIRRRKLKFRAWHRGMREVDLLLGRFADAHVDAMSDAFLADFEALLDLPDPEILGWITGEFTVPTEYDTPFLRQLIAFHR